MPSGRTHDSITLWSLPVVAGLTFQQTQSGNLTLIVSGGFLFSGLMFGPDLDIYSCQYRRWGLLRWIWLPYRRGMRHRSLLSHGPLIGTVVRVLYLAIWLMAFGLVALLLYAIASQFLNLIHHWQPFAQRSLQTTVNVMGRSLQEHPAEWLALAIGLELGSLSHAGSDWAEFIYKRYFATRSTPTPSKSPRAQSRQSGKAPVEPPLHLPDFSNHPVPPRVQPDFPDRPAQPSKPTSPAAPPHLRRIPQLPPFIRQRRQ